MTETDDGKCHMVTGPRPGDDDPIPKGEPLTRDDILAVEDKEVKPVWIPEWGGRHVYVRVISGRERDLFEADIRGKPGATSNLYNFRARFAVLVCSDADGKPLFTDRDVTALGNKSARGLERIFDAGRHFNKFTEKDIDDLEKNSEGDRTDDSGSS